MAKKNNSMIMFFLVLPLSSIIAWNSMANIAYGQQADTAQDQALADWSKNATDAETNDLIQQAERILQQSKQETSNGQTSPTITEKEAVRQAALMALAQSRNSTVTLPEGPAANSPAPVAPAQTYTASTNMATMILSWLPGIASLLISIAMIIYIRSQVSKNQRAGSKASSLIAEAQDMHNNIKEWEIDNHYNHINEISSHIDAMNDTIVLAREVKDSVNQTINKGVVLNQKSLEILKKANKELSKSLTSQVNSLEEQLKSTVENEIQKMSQLAADQIATFKAEKETMISEVEQKTSLLKHQQSSMFNNMETQNHKIEDKQQSNASMIDMITKELDSLKAKNSSIEKNTTSEGATEKSHADMLRESIARQKAAISGSSAFSNFGSLSSSTSKSTTKTTVDKKDKSSSILDELNDKLASTRNISSDNKPERKPVTVQKESTTTTSDGIEIKTRDINTSKNETANTAEPENKYASLDSKELMNKLTHAEKWRNFKAAAEICQEMAKRGTDKSEVFDIWGQMLARQASMEKGQESTTLLKEASQKMQKASMLDSGNYKIFNNWGVILKNLALACTSNHEMEKNLAVARRKFETSLGLNPQNHEALNNWGNTLMIQSRFRTGAMQESLLNSACEKFAEAVNLKPDKEVSLYSWGNALFKLANCKNDKSTRNKLLIQAQQRWEQANKIKPGIASKELRVIRSMVPTLETSKDGKKVTEYKFKTLNS